MNEPAVALTDYALTIENALLAAMLWRVGRRTNDGAGRLGASARWFIIFFSMVAISSVMAGTFHGFIVDENASLGGVMWRAVMLSVGLTAFAAANAGGSMWREKTKKIVAGLALAVFAGYCVLVLLGSQDFRYAIYIYMPATIFLLGSFLVAYTRVRARGLLLGALGLLLTFVAAMIQQSSIYIANLRLDHNALYHVAQAFALILIYLGARTAVQMAAAEKAHSLVAGG